MKGRRMKRGGPDHNAMMMVGDEIVISRREASISDGEDH